MLYSLKSDDTALTASPTREANAIARDVLRAISTMSRLLEVTMADNVLGNNSSVATTESQVTTSEPKKAHKKSAPKWELDTRERLRSAIRKFSKPLSELVARDANEGDTRLLVTDFLCEGLGYDKYTDLTTEYQVRGEFADYGVRIEKDLIAFIEVKRVATKLDAKHLRQVEMYAVNEGVQWVILTNGANWKVYHITGGLPVIIDLALDVNLLGEESLQYKASLLYYLTRESLKRQQIDDLWRAKRATSPKSLARVLLAPPVLAAVQKELRRQTGHVVEPTEIEKLLKNTVFRSEALEKA